MTNDQIIAEAVKRAQQEGRVKGFKVGATVAHPDEPLVGELIEINGEDAWLDCGNEYTQKFPLNELFDPTVALKFCLEIELPGVEVNIQ